MKFTVLLLGAALLLAACDAGSTNNTGGYRSQGGGSAGSHGPLYCQTVPSDLSARSDWNRICHSQTR